MKHYIPTGRHGILVPRFKDLVAQGMGMSIALEGRFRLITHSKRYGSRVRADFKNLILNQGLNRMAAGASITACQVGTGTTSPAVGQTTLANYFAGTTASGAADTNSYIVGPPPYHQMVRTRRFAEGTFSSTNLTEVGMGWTTTTGNLFSRALILDGGGSPTTITVLADETLDVEYTLRSYPPTSDVNGTISLDGNSYDYTIRAANVGNLTSGSGWSVEDLIGGAIGSTSAIQRRVYPSTSTLGAITGFPSGPSSNVSSASLKTYTAGDYSRGFSITAGLTVNPSGGIACADFALGPTPGGAVMQMSFSPVIPKNNTKILVLEPRIHWARR